MTLCFLVGAVFLSDFVASRNHPYYLSHCVNKDEKHLKKKFIIDLLVYPFVHICRRINKQSRQFRHMEKIKSQKVSFFWICLMFKSTIFWSICPTFSEIITQIRSSGGKAGLMCAEFSFIILIKLKNKVYTLISLLYVWKSI